MASCGLDGLSRGRHELLHFEPWWKSICLNRFPPEIGFTKIHPSSHSLVFSKLSLRFDCIDIGLFRFFASWFSSRLQVAGARPLVPLSQSCAAANSEVVQD